jgi:ABC-type bacteriocin/lantibiotic exporter with double-glycine peptidase domain
MLNEQKINELVVRAVQRAFDAWAVEHSTLADVIDRITLTQRAIESMRASEEFRRAIAHYQNENLEATLLGQLVEVAKPLIVGILAA